MKMKTMAMIFLVMLSLLNKVLVRITRQPGSRCKKFSVSSEKLFESTLYRKANKQKKRGGLSTSHLFDERFHVAYIVFQCTTPGRR
jgi:hypothetical protein